MATYYWFGGTGNWDTTAVDNWSTVSGTTFLGTMTGTTTLTVASVVGTALAIGKTVRTTSGSLVGKIVSGSGTTWVLDTAGTYTSEPMGAGTIPATPAAPTSADTVIFDGNSGTGTVLIGADAYCSILTASAITANTKLSSLFSGGSSLLHITTSAAIAAAATYDATYSPLTLYFDSAATTTTLNCASTTLIEYIYNQKSAGTLSIATSACTCRVFYQGSATTTLSVNLTCEYFNLNAGTFNVNALTLNVKYGIQDDTAGSTRSLVMTTGTINLGTSITTTNLDPISWNLTQAGLTFTRGTGKVVIGSTTPQATYANFYPNNLVFYDVLFQGTQTVIYTAGTYTGATTFGFRVTTPAALNHFLIIAATQTVTAGTFSVVGNSATNRALISSGDSNGNFTPGTSASIVLTGTGTRTLTNVDLQAIAFTYSTPLTGTSIGNWGGNSNVTVTTPVTRYAVTGGTAKNWSSTTLWSATSGGATGATVPLAQDTVIFNAASGSGAVTVDIRSLGSSITTTGFTGTTVTPSITYNLLQTVHGQYTGAVSFLNVITSIWFNNRTGAGITIPGGLTNSTVRIDGPSVTQTLSGAINSPSSSWTLYTGTFSTGNYDFSVFSFDGTPARVTAVTLGSSTVTVVSQWNYAATVSAGTSTIILTPSVSSCSFFGGGKTYNTLRFAPSGTNNSCFVFGSNTFSSWTNATTNPIKINISSGTTNTISTFSISGIQGSPVIIGVNGSTSATIAIGSNATTNYTLFRKITKSGASTLTAYGVADLTGNTNIVFPSVVKTVAFSSGSSSFVVPSNFLGSSMLIAVGAGGGGVKSNSASYAGGAGGGGGYSALYNPVLSSGTTVYFSVGAGGAGATTSGSGGNGGSSWMNVVANSSPASISQGVLANGGRGASGLTAAGLGGSTSGAIGNDVFAGGAGGAGTASGTGGAAGGSASSYTAYSTGFSGARSTTNAGGGAGGGGVLAGGSISTSTNGGAGGQGLVAGTGGTGGTRGAPPTAGGNGTNGGGGGGGGAVSSGANTGGRGGDGSVAQEFLYNSLNGIGGTGYIGSGGGGGGGGSGTVTGALGGGAGGNGVYGGGGGAGGRGLSIGAAGNGGNGGSGFVVFMFEAAGPSTSFGSVIG